MSKDCGDHICAGDGEGDYCKSQGEMDAEYKDAVDSIDKPPYEGGGGCFSILLLLISSTFLIAILVFRLF